MRTWLQRCVSTLARVLRTPRLRKHLAATTPSALSSVDLDRYISRDEAAARYDGTAKDIFQGDIYRSVEIMIPQPSGAWRDPVPHDYPRLRSGFPRPRSHHGHSSTSG
jgi:hypothetical protein